MSGRECEMTTRNKIGAAMMAVPSIGLFVWGAALVGWPAIAAIFAGTALVVAWVGCAVGLLNDEG